MFGSEHCGDVLIDMTTKAHSMKASNMANNSHENHQISNLGLYKEDANRFDKILRTMNLDNIPNFASNVRQYGHCSTVDRSTGNNPAQFLPEPSSISCKLILPPLCGSFHIVFPIEFVDGVTWMLKISASGDHFDSVAASALESEARTMQMLRKETSIPVPAVYAFDASSSNALSSPFILMEKLGGTPLSHLWFDSEVPKARLEHFRVRTLQSLAGVMVQLNKFTLNTGGSLVFDSDGTPVGLGGAKVMDGVAIFNKATASHVQQQDCDGGGENISDEVRFEAAKPNTTKLSGSKQADAEESDDDDIFCERGPFNHPKEYFLSNLDRSDPTFRADAYERGSDMILRLFIEWAFADSRNHDRRFVLTHPDLDVQNILVAEDGTMTGLIDWDGVAAVPRQVGCAQYPLWLMRDWVPLRYNYDTQKGKPCTDVGYEESSPAELASYRALYAQLMEVEIGKMNGGMDKTTAFGTLPKQEAQLTRRSLVMRNLDLSAGDPWVALGTVNHIIDQIEELTAPDWEDTDSDLDSISSCSSLSDSGSIIDSDSDEEDEEAEAPETKEQGTDLMKENAPSHHAEQELGGMDRVVPEEPVKVDRSSWEILEQNQVSSTSSDASEVEIEAPEMQEPSGMDLQHDSSTPSAPLGWTRRLLRFGCNTAEKSLRRIAKIGYASKSADDEVKAVSTEIEIRRVEAFVEGDHVQVVKSETPQQTVMVEIPQDIETQRSKDTPSNDDTGGLEQLIDVRSIELIEGLQEITSTQTVVNPEQIKRTISLPPTVEPQDIPLRKAELLQAARMKKKAERKAHYLYDKAAIKKELKVWENIALAVWRRGVSLEQLQMNQGKIAGWVVDTLRAEQQHEEDGLTTSTHRPPAAQATAAAAEMVDSRIATLSLLEDDSTRSNKEPEEGRLEEDRLKAAKIKGIESLRVSKVTSDGIAGNDRLESKVSQITSIITTQDVSAPESGIFEIFDDKQEDPQPLTVDSSTTQPQARLCRAQNSRTSKPSGASKQTKKRVTAKGDKTAPILANENPSLIKNSACTIVPDNHVSLKQPEIPSDRDEMATGMNLGSKKVMLDGKAARNFFDVTEAQQEPGSSSTNEDHSLPEKAKAGYSLRILCKCGTSYSTQIFSNQSQSEGDEAHLSPDSSVHSDSGNEEGGSDIGGARSSATSLSDGVAEDRENEEIKDDKDDPQTFKVIAADEGDRSEGEDEIEPEEDRSTTATSTEARRGEPTDTGDGAVRGDTNSEGGHEDRAGRDGGDESSTDGEVPEFEDDGRFDHYTVCNLLGMGELDEVRLLRLKEGFLKLLEQY